MTNTLNHIREIPVIITLVTGIKIKGELFSADDGRVGVLCEDGAHRFFDADAIDGVDVDEDA